MKKETSIQGSNSQSNTRATSGRSGSTTANSPKSNVLFIQNVRFCTNENSELARNVIYAELADEKSKVVISADLPYIFEKIIERGYVVADCTIEDGPKGKEVKFKMRHEF